VKYQVYEHYDIEKAKRMAVRLVESVGLTPERVRIAVGSPAPRKTYANTVTQAIKDAMICEACGRPL
jgi:hypothetical protein